MNIMAELNLQGFAQVLSGSYTIITYQLNRQMELAEEAIRQPNNGYQNANQYEQLKAEYATAGITYKSNEILHKVSLIKGYPYPIMLEIANHFHLNQFQVIFFSHILTDEDNSYDADPTIFQTPMNLPELTKIYNRMSKNGQIQIKIVKTAFKGRIQEQDQDDDDNENEDASSKEIPTSTWTLKELKKLFIYLLVIGYSVKYYLNQSTKAYEDEMKKRYPDFFTSIFNVWVDKYSNKVLRTNPRKINEFYIELFQSEENTAIENTEIDCQYRNYNQIVEQLIKATSDADEGLQHEEERDFTEN